MIKDLDLKDIAFSVLTLILLAVTGAVSFDPSLLDCLKPPIIADESRQIEYAVGSKLRGVAPDFFYVGQRDGKVYFRRRDGQPSCFALKEGRAIVKLGRVFLSVTVSKQSIFVYVVGWK